MLVPLLVAGGFLWATWNSDSRLDRVQAAIVNEDKPVRLNGQLVPLGRQLAGGLVTGGDDITADENFDWLLTDSDDAAAGLASGRYAAVVRIPANFSARATSFSKSKAAQIGPAEISVETSQIRGISDSVVGQTIATAATAALNTSLTKNYLDNIYLGFNKTKKQFESVAKGARKLADGTGDLSDGLGQTSKGTTQLADGLDQLDGGAQQLATGTGQLSTGASQLADGLKQLADGTRSLPGGARKLADGAEKSADGAGKLATGVKKYTGGLTQLNKGTNGQPGFGEFANGAERFARGAGQYGTLGAGTGKFVKGVSAGFDDQSQTLGALARSSFSQQSLVKLKAVARQFEFTCPAGLPDQQCFGLLQTFVGGVAAGFGGANFAMTDAPDGSDKSLVDLAALLQQGGSGLEENGPLIAKGLDGFAGGIDQLADNGPKLATGTRQLADGLDQLADGTDELATGLKPLATGISQTSTGATKLASGIGELATGTKDLAGGTAQSATGASKLSDGLVKLDDGAGKLADGSDELATGLEKGAKQIPTYDKTTRTKLAEVVATPVTAEQPTSLFADIANTTLLAALALWLGGLASFIVLRAVPAGVLTSMKSSWRLALAAFLPAAGIAAVQAVALTVVLQVLLQLDAGRVVLLLPFLLLAGLAFAAVNQGLVAWLGGIGRFVSVAVVVLSAAAAITSAVPAVFDLLTPFLPLTPALEGARAIISNGAGTVGTVGLVVAWLIIGAAASVLAVARRRLAPARALVPAT